MAELVTTTDLPGTGKKALLAIPGLLLTLIAVLWGTPARTPTRLHRRHSGSPRP